MKTLGDLVRLNWIREPYYSHQSIWSTEESLKVGRGGVITAFPLRKWRPTSRKRRSTSLRVFALRVNSSSCTVFWLYKQTVILVLKCQLASILEWISWIFYFRNQLFLLKCSIKIFLKLTLPFEAPSWIIWGLIINSMKEVVFLFILACFHKAVGYIIYSVNLFLLIANIYRIRK